jgi:hypothetical protein
MAFWGFRRRDSHVPDFAHHHHILDLGHKTEAGIGTISVERCKRTKALNT